MKHRSPADQRRATHAERKRNVRARELSKQGVPYHVRATMKRRKYWSRYV